MTYMHACKAHVSLYTPACNTQVQGTYSTVEILAQAMCQADTAGTGTRVFAVG